MITLTRDLLGLFVLGGLIDEVLSDLMLLTRQAPNDVLITPFLSLRFFPCKNTVSFWVIVAFKELLDFVTCIRSYIKRKTLCNLFSPIQRTLISKSEITLKVMNLTIIDCLKALKSNSQEMWSASDSK